MPETTVLIPTFNNSQYIIQSLKSVINQKYRDFEVIIIDDCSDDNTEELVSELDTRIRYFRKKTKTGIVSCLNEGLAYANGKFIARMDADDIMLGNRLLNQVNFLNNNKEYGVVGSKYNVISMDGEILETVSTKQNDEELRLGLLFKNQFAHSSVTFRRELHSNVLKYQKKYEFVEDYALWCEFSKISKLANLPEINLSYRIHGKNSSHQNQKVLRSNLVKLLSVQLDNFGIIHDERELAMHAKLSFFLGTKFQSRISLDRDLILWITKVFESPYLLKNFSPMLIKKFKEGILKDYA